MSSRSKNTTDGDWTCVDAKCANVNFARRSSCNRCGKDKLPLSDSKSKKQGIEIGKIAAEKSHGLFSAEDWQCTKCGNVNWARRNTCNMCNAPRVGELEERTGYGGGFNERTGVEYVPREESDDEYDEYGRIKKKVRNNDRPAVTTKVTKHEETESEEDDEDVDLSKYEFDDDEDDGDLSKYDLGGEDDNESNKEDSAKNEINNVIKKTPSRSYSSSSASSYSSSSSSSSSRSSSKSVSRSPQRKNRERSRYGQESSSKRRYSSSGSRSPSHERKSSRK